MQKQMTTKAVLNGLIDLFSTPEKWIKGQLYQTDNTGKKIQWCLVGGVQEVCGSLDTRGSYATTIKVGKALRFTGPEYRMWDHMINWNNSEDTDYDTFMARLHKGLQRVESRYGHRKGSAKDYLGW